MKETTNLITAVKIPVKPFEPYKPVLPDKQIPEYKVVRSIGLRELYDRYVPFSEFLEMIDIETYTHTQAEIFVRFDNDWEDGDDVLEFSEMRMIENPNYDKQMIEYEKNVKHYERYEKELEQYNKGKKEYDTKQEKARIKVLEKELAALKDKYQNE